MDTVKKGICYFLIVCMMLFLVACGSKGDADTSSNTDYSSTSEKAETDNRNEETTLTVGETEDKTEISENPDSKDDTKVPETSENKDTTTPQKNETSAPPTSEPTKNTTSPSNPGSTANESKPTVTPPTASKCNHPNTEIRNAKEATTSAEGYTGDTYCKDCGTLISKGSAIAKKPVFTAAHDYYDIETGIFNLINEERAKAGIAPLTWDEKLYPGTKIRAKEYAEYKADAIGTGPHTRPDGSDFYTAITKNSDYAFDDFSIWGENCAGRSHVDGGKGFFESWMNSDGHRYNILNPEYTKAAIAVYKHTDGMYYATNIFVG